MSLSSLELDAFFTVAKVRNFTRAAKELFVTQSELSQRILNLEDKLETALLIRDRQDLRLTEAGQNLFEYCRIRAEMGGEVLSCLQSRDQALSGTLRIGGFSSVMNSVIFPAIAPLLRSNAGIKLHSFTREMEELPRLLRQAQIDFMILDRLYPHEEIETVALGSEEYVLVESTRYSPVEIYLDHDEIDQITWEYLKKFKLLSKKNSLQRRYVDDTEGLIAGAKQGLGKAVVPKHLLDKKMNLRILHPTQILKTPVILHYYKMPYYSELQKKVLETLTTNAPMFLS